MSLRILGSLVFGFGLLACGSDDSSGVAGSKKLVELSTTEIGDLCDYTSDVQGGYGTSKVCGDGITVTVPARASCISRLEATAASCTATVDTAEACAEAVGEDLCKLLSEPKCAFALQCSDG
ncbi:MAG: hypothetical protein H0T42_34460 [Deltaproteobacteria bacterium]|nr:hypothetical protein [Deltaproteobacteria bacterium]